MKKLLLGSLSLLIFSTSIMIFQISCKKDVIAQSPTITATRFIYTLQTSAGVEEIWTAKLDGTEKRKVPIAIPSNYEIRMSDDFPPSISPDGQIIIFQMKNITNNIHALYKCNIDGSGVIKIMEAANAIDGFMVGSMY